jgi:hypothetical protein
MLEWRMQVAALDDIWTRRSTRQHALAFGLGLRLRRVRWHGRGRGRGPFGSAQAEDSEFVMGVWRRWRVCARMQRSGRPWSQGKWRSWRHPGAAMIFGRLK